MSTSDDVLELIQDAFPSLPIDFVGATAGGLDGGEFRAQVDGKAWDCVDATYLVKRNDALSFLDATHVAAVLPVYLRSLVIEGTRTTVPDTLLLVLNRKNEKRFTELCAALTGSQRDAVVAALDLFAAANEGTASEEARAASLRWKQHMPTGGSV